ncbi:hypothetical protein ACFQZ4_35075 [Catellatospora coxensis]
MTLPLDPSQRPTPVAAARPAMGWWRRHRVLRNWLGGVASAVVVSVISGVALAYLTPGADTPVAPRRPRPPRTRPRSVWTCCPGATTASRTS